MWCGVILCDSWKSELKILKIAQNTENHTTPHHRESHLYSLPTNPRSRNSLITRRVSPSDQPETSLNFRTLAKPSSQSCSAHSALRRSAVGRSASGSCSASCGSSGYGLFDGGASSTSSPLC